MTAKPNSVADIENRQALKFSGGEILLKCIRNRGATAWPHHRSVIVVPQALIMETNPRHQPHYGGFQKGGRFMDPHGNDLTGFTAARGVIDVTGAQTVFDVWGEAEPAAKAQGPICRINLVSKQVGGRWVEKYLPLLGSRVVSVERSREHHYGLEVLIDGPLTLASFPVSPTDPRLRPTTRGDVQMGRVAGIIEMRGNRRLVFETLTVAARRVS